MWTQICKAPSSPICTAGFFHLLACFLRYISQRKHFSSGILVRFSFWRTVPVPCLHQSLGRWRSWIKRKYTGLQLTGLCLGNFATNQSTERRSLRDMDAESRSRCFPQGWTKHALNPMYATHTLPATFQSAQQPLLSITHVALRLATQIHDHLCCLKTH